MKVVPSCSTRRQFIKTASVSTAMAGISATSVRGQQQNGRLRIAVIGCGGRGRSNLRAVAPGNQIVALCDVNQESLDRAGESFPKARKEIDFRRLFDHADEFDAVVVSTCEHTHAFATLPALQLGKHVYCEKPLTYNIWEARVIRQAAANAGVATQMGTQIHAGDNYRRVVELIQTGAIGAVREVHVWVSRAWGWHTSLEASKQQGDIVHVQDRPKSADPIPKGLHWDLWLGPAPARPFNHVYVPGPKWYRWWDFGNGTMSDLGSHFVDLPFWALNLDYPRTVEAQGPAPHPELAPASMRVRYEYAARGERPPVELTWYQGVDKPDVWKAGDIPQWKNGHLFIGEKGMLLSDYRKHVLLPEDRYADFARPKPFIPGSRGHHAEWLHACKTGAPTTCNFDYAGWLTEANHLGNVAFRVGKKIDWDAEKMEAVNCSEAAPFIKRSYRQGWNLV